MGENKDADQLRGNREADQRLCFRYTDSTFPPLLIPKFSRFWVSSVTVQAGLCRTWSEPQIVGFLMHRLIYFQLQELRNVNKEGGEHLLISGNIRPTMALNNRLLRTNINYRPAVSFIFQILFASV